MCSSVFITHDYVRSGRTRRRRGRVRRIRGYRVPTTSASASGGTGVSGVGTVGDPGMMGGGMMGGGMMGGSGNFPFVSFTLTFLAFAALIVLGYVGVRALAGGDERDRADEVADGDREADPIARIQRQYTEGDLTEAEFERALERELGDKETDGGDDRGGASAERSLSGRQR